MRKRVVTGLCTLLFALCLIASTGLETKASNSMPMLDGSYLTHKTEVTGEAVAVTRGEHLQTGYSKLVVVGPGEIYAGGTTIAEHICKSVKITVIVERAKLNDTEWEVVDTWRKENTDANLASTSKRLKVDGGWYYRVCCVHSADGDISDSFTDGAYVKEP